MQVNGYTQPGRDELRKEYLSKRRALSSASVLKASDIIFKKLICLEEYANADDILIYSSCDNEVMTDKIIKYSIKENKNVFLPKCIDSRIMEFYKITGLSDLNRGMYGIPEPDGGDKYVNNESSLCIVPAICFDKRGFRLGYGKGYYDRFLSRFSGFTVGIAIDEFILEKLPIIRTDISVKRIVTDKKIYEKEGE